MNLSGLKFKDHVTRDMLLQVLNEKFCVPGKFRLIEAPDDGWSDAIEAFDAWGFSFEDE